MMGLFGFGKRKEKERKKERKKERLLLVLAMELVKRMRPRL